MPSDTIENTPSGSRGHLHFIDQRVVAALDNGKVSDPMAIHILIAVAEALAKCWKIERNRVADLVINRSSLRSFRQKARGDNLENVQADFVANVLADNYN